MAQNDMNIANQGFPGFRADLNDALGALVSTSSGATEPATTFAHQLWVDTSGSPSVLRIRNADNDAFIAICSIDQVNDKITVLNATQIKVGSVTYTLPTADGTSGQAIQTDGSGTLSFATISAAPGGSTTQVQFNNAGAFGGISGVTTDGTRMTASTTIGVGGATPSTSGSGISFPATQSASTNANTLDDYEEGTFTPSLTFETSGSVSGEFLGSYVKIGSLVYVSIAINLSGTSSPSGTAKIEGLPFTVLQPSPADDTFVGSPTFGIFSGFGSSFVARGLAQRNTTVIALFKGNTNEAVGVIGGSDFTSSSRIYCTVSYRTT